MPLLDALFPLRCARCGSTGASPCPQCIADLRPVGAVQVGAPVAAAVSAVAYDDAAAPFVAALKRRGTRPTVRWFAAAIAMVVDRIDEAPEVVTWVPASPANARRRGFDQGALLARSVGEALAVPVVAAFRRVPGPAQVGRDRAHRLVGPAISLRRDLRVAQSTVLVVDDVITTGASVRSAASALREAGAGRVIAGAAAHRL